MSAPGAAVCPKLTRAQAELLRTMGIRSNVLKNGDEYQPMWWLEGAGAVNHRVANSLIRKGFLKLTGREGGHPGILSFTVSPAGRAALAQVPE